jgi:D-alanine-D-alanine ligase
MGGCSRGIDERNPAFSNQACIELVQNTIDQNHQPALVEEFITGREFTAGILGNDPPQMLPILEIIQDVSEDHKFPFRSFNIKMIEGKSEKKSCPAVLSELEEERIKNIALKAYQVIECRDYARIDIRCEKNGNPYVLEVNAFPSLIPNASSFSIMAKTAGISFENLVGWIINYACDRYNIDQSQLQ